MSAISGLIPAGDYSTGTDKQKVALLRSLIPNPDAAPASSPAIRFFDEMSPGAAAQLRVELIALEAAVS